MSCERQQYLIHSTLFDLPPRYELSNSSDHDGGGAVGFSAFGAICRAFDRRSNDQVLIKKVNCEGKEDQIVGELQLLTRLRHYGIVRLLNGFTSESKKGFEIYLVSPVADSDLSLIIKSEQILSKAHVRVIAFQLLETAQYLHECGVIVTCIAPSNVLCNYNCSIMLADLGRVIPVATTTEPVNVRFLRNDSSLLHYRSPEILLDYSTITPTSDIWSIGCIVVELLHRKPLFLGQTWQEQVCAIVDLLGIDKEQFQSQTAESGALQSTFHNTTIPLSGTSELINSNDVSSGVVGELPTSQPSASCRQFLISMGKKLPVPVRSFVPQADKFLVDMLENMIVFEPTDRLSAYKLLDHPYFDGHNTREISFEKPSGTDSGLIVNTSNKIVLSSVKLDSPASVAGVDQFVGYKLVSINNTSAAHLDASSISGKSLTHMTLRFGSLAVSPLAELSRWDLSSYSKEELHTIIEEELEIIDSDDFEGSSES